MAPKISKRDQKQRTKFKVYFISSEPTFYIADASAAAAQKKKLYETMKRANNSIDVLGIKDKIVTSQCDHV